MKLKRHSTFETNSSSCHSISIDDNVELYDTIVPNENGLIVLEGGQFGWEIEQYTDALTKANYVAVSLKCHLVNEYLIEMFENVMLNHTGAEGIVYEFENERGRYESYIDHQSIETGPLFDYSDPDQMKNFIFNPKSILYTDNDNH